MKQPIAIAVLSACCAAGLYAQGRGAVEWTTSGFDAQRSGWIRTDPRISVAAMQKPGEFGPFKFLWKLKLEHEPKAATALTEPILLDRLIGFRGFKSIAFVGTASETVHAVDIDYGVPLWKYHINYSASPPPVIGAPAPCSGGLTAAMSRPTAIVASTATGGGFGGGAGQSGGGVGAPGQGVRTLAVAGRGRGGAPPPPTPSAPPPGTVPGSAAAAAGAVPGGLPGGARAGGPGIFGGTAPFSPGADAAYAVGSDGYLHALNVSNGWDSMTPALFLPANTHAMGLIVATGADGSAAAYAATTHGCGSQPDAVYAMDLGSPHKSVVAFSAGGATIAGSAAPTLGRDGTVYVATKNGPAPLSNALVALEPRTLKPKSSATVAKADFNSSPLVFPWKDGDGVAVAGNGKLFVFDAAHLQGGPIAEASLPGAAYESGALATWLDAQGTRWIAAPSARAIATFKVADSGSKAMLQPGWTSRIITAPRTPLVINGVLFAVSSGTRTVPAVLYAIDAATGTDLWNSARTITSSIRGGLSGGSGNVYVPGADGTLYAFGFEIEK
jgi:outer membrane protein assembly factor BamB